MNEQELDQLRRAEENGRQRIEKDRVNNQMAQAAIVEHVLKSAASDQEGQALCRQIQQVEIISNQVVRTPGSIRYRIKMNVIESSIRQ